MKHSKKFIAAGAAALASVALAAPSFADPVRPYVTAGSDTIQDVWNGLTNDSTAVAPSIASWNATSGGVAYNTIQTKTGGTWFARPNGSGDGLKAVCATWDSTGDPTNKLTLNSTNYTLNTQDVDFGRSSSGPSGTSGTVQYLPFARDAVAIAFNTQPVGSASSGLPSTLNLTTGDITALYTGVPSADGVVTFTQADGSAEPSGNATADVTAKVFVNGLQVVPELPQGSSGTRKFFAGAAGISNTVGANAAYVSDVAGTVFGAGTAGPYEENNGRALTVPGAVIPFSAAQWISQQTAAASNTLNNSTMALSSINGNAAVTGSGSTAAQGPLFGSQNAAGAFNTVPVSGVGNFNRDTYAVVPGAFLPTGTPTPKQSALVSILTGGGIGQVFSGAGKTIIKKFGFGVLSYSVGTGSALPGDCPSGY